MAEGSVDLDEQGERNKIGPDLIGFYKSEILDLLAQDEDFLPLTPKTKEVVEKSSNIVENGKGPENSHVSSLFNNSIESGISDAKKELLKASLTQSVRALTQEVDEMFDPVIRICHVISCLNSRKKEKSNGKAPIVEDSVTPPTKKLKTSSSNVEGKPLHQNRDAEKEDVSGDLKLLLESDNSLVEDIMNKHSDELLLTLNLMEKELEGLLAAVVSKCRCMTLEEKQNLRELIEKLPARNLDRIVEIIHHGKSSSEIVSLEKIFVDLENQENTTLWRLYFYVKAVENARKLSA